MTSQKSSQVSSQVSSQKHSQKTNGSLGNTSKISSENLIACRNYAPANLGNVLILGLGATGKAAAKYCTSHLGERVESVVVYGGKKTNSALDFAREIEEAGARVVFDTENVQGKYDLCIASPGISQFSAFYESAQEASAEVISEIEFAWRECPQDIYWVAITGTNGKTTTTQLTSHVLLRAGLDVFTVGNIGNVALEAIARIEGSSENTTSQKTKVFVVEVSSYQLASTKYFAPNVAVLLNITPDHLHWHKTIEEYKRSKLRIFANMSSSSTPNMPLKCAILDATNSSVRETVRAFKAIPENERGFSYIPLGTKLGYTESMHDRCGAKNAAYIKQETSAQDTSAAKMCVLYNNTTHALADIKNLQLKGNHNYGNALAAASVAIAFADAGIQEISDDVIARALCEAQPLEHRIEPCGTCNGVSFYNDSKATNTDAAIVAIQSFPQSGLIVLLGGEDKDTSLDSLIAQAKKCAHHVICYGQARERFASEFKRAACENMLLEANNMSEAFDVAVSVARAGDVILLSPACASFDEFNSFEHRGETFKELVRAYIEENERAQQ